MAKKLTIKAQLDKIYKSKLSGKLGTKKRNEAFHALSDEDKRREIALDSLQLLLIGSIVGSHSSYWGERLQDIKEESQDSKQLQKNFIKVEELQTCSVCARGAVMLSTIRLGNCLSPEDYNVEKGDVDTVQGFEMNTMELMEQSYEYGYHGSHYSSNTDARLGNILLNVIANGDFNIEDNTDYVDEFELELSNERLPSRELGLDNSYNP